MSLLRPLAAIVLGLSSLLVGPVVHAADDNALQLCTTVWPPYTIVDPLGQEILGIHTDFVREVFKRLKQPIKISEAPWKRCLQDAQDGKIDVVYSASRNAEREAFLHFPAHPLQTVSYSFFTLKKAKSGWDSKRDLTTLPQPIGAPLGYSTTEELKAAGLLVEETPSDLQNIRKLVIGRVASVLVEEQVGMLMFEKVGALAQVKLLQPPYVEGKAYYISVSKRSPNAEILARLIDHQVELLTKEKLLENLLRRY